jgi:flagellar hook-associated protein FlgK
MILESEKINSFKKEFRDSLKNLQKQLSDNNKYKDLYRSINECISCLNELNHEVIDISHYSDDPNDWL